MRFFVYITLIAALLFSFVPAQAMLESTVVEPANMNGWMAYQDKGTGGGRISFMSGPDEAPLGEGSARIVIENNMVGWFFLKPVTPETKFSDISRLEYSTYVTTNGSTEALSLQLGVDYDPDDEFTGYQGRLVFEPTYNGAVTKSIWQDWNAILDSAVWYATGRPGSDVCGHNTRCTWKFLKETYPDARFHHVEMHSLIGFKAGSGWNTFDGNVDKFVFGLKGVDTTYDFEPASTVYVDDDWGAVAYNTDPDGEGPAKLMGFDASATVQGGVNLVRTGGTVKVAEGTYTEQVLVNNLDGITIEGAGEDEVTIKATTSMISTVGDDRKPVFFVGDSDDVTVKELTLDGAGTGAYNNRLYGLFYHNSSGSVENVTSKAMRHEPLNGVQGGVGFYFYNTTPADLNTVTVTNCTAIDYQKGGFVFNGVGLTAIAEDNRAEGMGPTPLIAMNGIQVGYGATATVTGNTVTGNDYTGTQPATSAGILVYQASAEIIGNNIISNEVGISTNASTFKAVYNYITDSEYGIGQDGGVSEIIGNNITTNDYGIDVYTFEKLKVTDRYTAEATITHNRFFNNTVGVANEIFKYADQETPELDALDNWWGCNEGPNTDECDGTYADGYPVNVDSWLQLNLTSDVTHVFDGKPATLTATITKNYPGQVVTEPVEFPEGKDIAFSTTSTTALLESTSEDMVGGSASTVLTVGFDELLGTTSVSATLDNETVTLNLLSGWLKVILPLIHNLSGN